MAEPQDKLVTYAARLASAKDWDGLSSHADLKRLVALCWPYIPYGDRTKFYHSLDDDLLYQPLPGVEPETEADARMAYILSRWGEVLEFLEGDELNFAKDVMKRRSWRKWKPSEKQAKWILQIWASHAEADVDVTED